METPRTQSSTGTGYPRARHPDAVPFPVVHRAIKIERSITVARPPEEVYAFWHKSTNLPRIFSRLETLEPITARRSHWTWRSVAGVLLQWETEIIAELPGKMLSWQTLDGADIPHAGSIWFLPAPGGNGTEIKFIMAYDLPGGRLLNMITSLAGENPKQIITDDLRRMKQILETDDFHEIDGQVNLRQEAH